MKNQNFLTSQQDSNTASCRSDAAESDNDDDDDEDEYDARITASIKTTHCLPRVLGSLFLNAPIVSFE